MPRHTRESVIQLVVDAGGTPELAATIYDELAAVGLNAAEVRAWLVHPERAHPIPAGELTVAGVQHPREMTAIFVIQDGEEHFLLAELRRFTAATPNERRIATLFWATAEDARRLTGGDPARAAVIASIAELLLKRVGKPQHVADVARTELAPGSYERIVDRIMRGDEGEVLAALQVGTIDVHALQRDGLILFGRW